MQTAEKYFKFIKDHPELFKGSHDVFTPPSITNPIIEEINYSNSPFLVLYNIEFVISLVYTYNINVKNIIFYSDNSNKNKIAKSIGVKYYNCMDEISMNSRPVLLTNPPFTNGEQDASEIYTDIIDSCVEKFNPIAIGAVTPENLFNGGQKKKKLREKILKKYGLKNIRFLNQQRDWKDEIKVDTIFWVVEESYAGATTAMSRHHDQPYCINTKLHEYVDGGTQTIHDWLLNIQTHDKIKLRNSKPVATGGDQIKISKDYTDSYVVETGDTYDSHNSEWRVAFGYMRCNTCAIVPPGPSIPGKYRYLNFGANEVNARKFAAYMLSEPVRFIMKLIYTSRTLDNPQLAYVPKLDMNNFAVIDDQTLYQFWNLDADSQKEIKSIVGNEVPF